MTPSPFAVKVPWSTPVYRAFSGPHPMMTSLAGSFDGIRFDFDLPEPDTGDLARADRERAACFARLKRLHGNLPEATVAAFVDSRGVESQAALRPPYDLTLHHSMPFTFGQAPWAIHIEEVITLFAPFLWHGQSAHVRADSVPERALIRSLLEAPECRFVSSHLSHSVAALGTVFDSEAIAAKARHIPFGVDYPDVPRAAVEAAIARRDAVPADGPVHFLFTNSWSQDPRSLLVRGGLDVLLAFTEVVRRRPHWTLTVRSALPTEMLSAQFGTFVAGIPNVRVIDRPVSDTEMADLFMAADVYLLPSVGLHTVSILQAMYFGAVLIASDVPGNDEFVTEDENGVIVPGRRDVYSWYGEDGLLNQTFDPLFQGVDQPYTERLARTMLALGDDPARRAGLRREARRHVLTRHRLDRWQGGFETLLRGALETVPVGSRA